MLISIFHLLLHKHCQQLRISGRTEKGEREEERKMESWKKDNNSHGWSPPPPARKKKKKNSSGRMAKKKSDWSSKHQTCRFIRRVLASKTFWMHNLVFHPRNVAERMKKMWRQKWVFLLFDKLNPPEGLEPQKCLKVSLLSSHTSFLKLACKLVKLVWVSRGMSH